jgi:hypothetical protein
MIKRLVFIIFLYQAILVSFSPAECHFNHIFQDMGKDINRNGLIDSIDIIVGVTVYNPGYYKINGSLIGLEKKTTLKSSNYLYLKTGLRSVVLSFKGLSDSGTYTLVDLNLFDSTGKKVDELQKAHTTRRYEVELFIPANARLSHDFFDHGTDIDGDLVFDYLTIDVGIEVIQPGELTLSAYLYDNNTEVAWSIEHENLSLGDQTMHLDFDGDLIRRSIGKRIYTLKDIVLFAGSSDTYMLHCDSIKNAYNMTQYTPDEFE